MIIRISKIFNDIVYDEQIKFNFEVGISHDGCKHDLKKKTNFEPT